MLSIYQYRLIYRPGGHARIDLHSPGTGETIVLVLPTFRDAKLLVRILRHNNTVLYYPRRQLIVAADLATNMDFAVDIHELSSPKVSPEQSNLPIPVPAGYSVSQIPFIENPKPISASNGGEFVIGYSAVTNMKGWLPTSLAQTRSEPMAPNLPWKIQIEPFSVPIKHNIILDFGAAGLHWVVQHSKQISNQELRFLLWILRTMQPLTYDLFSDELASDWEYVGAAPPTLSPFMNQATKFGSDNLAVQSFANKLLGSMLSPLPPLDQWLQKHPNVAEAIRLDGEDGSSSYLQWQGGAGKKYKDMLHEAFNAAWNSTPWIWNDPPQNLVPNNPALITVVSSDTGHLIYFAHVAHCLALELKAELPWSIANYPFAWLDLLFNSNNVFHWNEKGKTYVTGGTLKQFSITPGLPQDAFAFLKAEKILGNSHFGTIVKFLDWSRLHLIHFGPGDAATIGMKYWNYDGAPPTSRMISGVMTVGQSNPSKLTHYVWGCHGMLAFMHAVLKCANIPVEDPARLKLYKQINLHKQVYFPSINRFLAHADHGHLKMNSLPPIPSTELLATSQVFNALFAKGTPGAEATMNLKFLEAWLTFKYVPIQTMYLSCYYGTKSVEDFMEHPKIGSGNFKPFWSKQQQQEFYAKLQWKTMALGGCVGVQSLMSASSQSLPLIATL